MNKRDEVLNNFVKEAVKKIEVNKFIQSQKIKSLFLRDII